MEFKQVAEELRQIQEKGDRRYLNISRQNFDTYEKENELIQPHYEINGFSENANEQAMLSQLKRDTEIKSKARDIEQLDKLKEDEQIEQEIQEEQQTEVKYDREVTEKVTKERGLIKNRLASKSHRWGKTKNKRLKTSSEKMANANKILNGVTDIKNADSYIESKERFEKYAAFYGEVRSADRYLAEAVSRDKLEEKLIKSKVEVKYLENMLSLCSRERQRCMERDNEPDAQSRKFLTEVGNKESIISQKLSEKTVIYIGHRMEKTLENTDKQIDRGYGEMVTLTRKNLLFTEVIETVRKGYKTEDVMKAVRPFLDDEDSELKTLIDNKKYDDAYAHVELHCGEDIQAVINNFYAGVKPRTIDDDIRENQERKRKQTE